jgi:predicted short-subunit dehydrogenase-like oxidoreductase (DUF2520 family)
MDVGVVGAGRVGTAVAVLLTRAGHRIVGVSGSGEATEARAAAWLPGVDVLPSIDLVRVAELVLLCTPDDRVADVVKDLATEVRRDAWVAHTAGSLGLGVLEPVLVSGARRLAIHPLQTFPDVERALERLPGCAAAVTADDDAGYDVGESIARDIGARPFRLADDRRPLYHAAAVFGSNDVVVVAGIAERLLRAAGVPDPMSALRPLQEATVSNVGVLGVGRALTGPVVRGDAGTVGANLAALAADAPDLIPSYLALCRVALGLAVDAGRLDASGRERVERALDPWS